MEGKNIILQIEVHKVEIFAFAKKLALNKDIQINCKKSYYLSDWIIKSWVTKNFNLQETWVL